MILCIMYNVRYVLIQFILYAKQYGYWNMDKGLVVTKNFSLTKQEYQSELKGKVLRITTQEVSLFLKFIFFMKTVVYHLIS